MLEMRSSLSISTLCSLGLLGALSIGCATTAGSANGDRVVVAVDASSHSVQSSSEVMGVTEIIPPVAPEAPQVRRRLSQTVTLGQGTAEAIYAIPPAAAQGQGQGGNNVTVNNNVTVVQQPPIFYGGYGGYGDGGYGTGNNGRDGASRGTPTSQAWAPSGWEGAGRTAAPGRTPGVGGNFSSAPSFGPRSMK